MVELADRGMSGDGLRSAYPKNTLIKIQAISLAVNLSRASNVKVVRNPAQTRLTPEIG